MGRFETQVLSGFLLKPYKTQQRLHYYLYKIDYFQYQKRQHQKIWKPSALCMQVLLQIQRWKHQTKLFE